jgi:hypothetical protein
MVARVILIDVSPRNAATGAAVTLRLAGGGADAPYYYGGNHYRAGVTGLPGFQCSINFDGDDFGTGGVPQAAEIAWQPSTKADLAAMAGYFWPDAPVTVRIGDESASGALPPVRLTGKVLSGTVESGALKLVLSDPAADMKNPLLTARYGGTGGIDGPAEWDAKIKRRVWGRVWNLAGQCIDKANNIYCYADPARPILAIDAVRDKGANAASLATCGWAGSAAATFAALQAAVAPQGGGVICSSIACVKWWTAPAGDLTADLRGEVGAAYVETTADIVERIVQAGPATPFAAGAIAAARSARPAPIGCVVDDEYTTVASLIDTLLGNSSLLWLLNANGEIVLREWLWGASAATATSLSVRRTSTFKPVVTRKIGYRKNQNKAARGDLAGIVLVDDVAFDDGSTLAAAIADAATTAIWGDVTGTGRPADNATVGATTGGNLTSSSLGTLSDGQVVTAQGTSAAIAGQAWAATNGTQAAVANANVPLGDNEVVNSDFGLMDAAWSTVYPLGFESAWTGNATNWASIIYTDQRVQMADQTYAFERKLSGPAPYPVNAVFDGVIVGRNSPSSIRRFALPVQPGERLFASAYIGHQSCASGEVVIGYFDDNGIYIAETGVGSVPVADVGTAAATTLRRDQLARSAGFVVVPSDGTYTGGTGRCRWAIVWTRFYLSGSPATSRGLTSGLMLSKVAAGQTAIPAYSPGPADRLATFGAVTGSSLQSSSLGILSDGQVVTNQGVSAAVAGQGPLTTSALTPAQVANANVPVGGNIVAKPTFEDGLRGLWNAGTVVSVSGQSFAKALQLTPAGAAASALCSDPVAVSGRGISVSPGDVFFFDLWIDTSTVTAGQWAIIGLDGGNDAGAYTGSSPQFSVAAGAGWQRVTYRGAIPSGVSKVQPFIYVSGGTGSVRFSNIVISRSQPGADVTATGTAAAIAGQAATATSSDFSVITGATKPADNATRNIVTYSASAPASPINGDLWVDTSGTFAVFKLRAGGAWVVGANALSAYNALSGKPVALADINTTESGKLAGIAAGADVTSANVAAGFIGMGALATLSSIATANINPNSVTMTSSTAVSNETWADGSIHDVLSLTVAPASTGSVLIITGVINAYEQDSVNSHFVTYNVNCTGISSPVATGATRWGDGSGPPQNQSFSAIVTGVSGSATITLTAQAVVMGSGIVVKINFASLNIVEVKR